MTRAGLLLVAADVSIVSYNATPPRILQRIFVFVFARSEVANGPVGSFPERGPFILQTFIIYFLQSFMGFFYYAFYIGDFAMLRSYLFSRLVTNAVSSFFFVSLSFVLS
jgi:hypothetical protein